MAQKHTMDGEVQPLSHRLNPCKYTNYGVRYLYNGPIIVWSKNEGHVYNDFSIYTKS